MLPPLDLTLCARWLLAGWLAAVALFTGVPSVDLSISRLFWNPDTGFALVDRASWSWLRHSLWNIEILVVCLAAVGCVIGIVQRRLFLGLPARVWGYVVALFLLVPVLAVNGGFKSFSGRARPAEVVEFGGDRVFTPAWEFADQCRRNCSFVSGEVSSAVALGLSIWLAAVLWRGLEHWQRVYLQVVAVFIPVFISVQRLATGRHFASDIIFAVLITLGMALALYALFLRVARGPGATTPPC